MLTVGACMEEVIGLGRQGAAEHRIVVALDMEH